jgi:hypothetical protein
VLLLVAGCLLVLWMLAKHAVLTASPRKATLAIAGAGALVTWLFDLVGGNNLELWGAVLLWLFLGLAVGSLIRSSPQRTPGRRAAASGPLGDLIPARALPTGGSGNGRDAAGAGAPAGLGAGRSTPTRST